MADATSEVRRLLSARNPFLIGKNYNRPAPAHVANGFAASTCGYSDRGSRVVALMRGHEPPLSEFLFARTSDWLTEEAMGELQVDLQGVFSPDRRVFEGGIGSPSLVHAAFVTNDPSDDGFGPAMGSLVAKWSPKTTSELKRLLTPTEPFEPATALAMVLAEDDEPSRVRPRPRPDGSWFGEVKGSGTRLARSLADFVEPSAKSESPQKRLDSLQHLSRGLYFSTIVAIALAPITELHEPTAEDTSGLGALLAWGGAAPGDKDHPVVVAAAQAYQRLVRQNQAGLVRCLERRMAAAETPSRLPEAQRGRAMILNLLADELPVAKAESIAKSVGALGTGKAGTRVWCEAVVARAFPEQHLAAGIRTMGRKIGLVGPDRGRGSPRFVLETPVLGTLVRGLVPPEGAEFTQFVDLLRTRFRIVVGAGSDDEIPARLGLWRSRGLAEQHLRQNQEDLRKRMVRAGLATEYSDGHTEVAGGQA